MPPPHWHPTRTAPCWYQATAHLDHLESVADSDSALSHEDSADSSKCGVEEAASTQSLRGPAALAGARPHSGSTNSALPLAVPELDPASRVALQRALASHRVLPQAATAVTSGSGGSASLKPEAPSPSSLPVVLSPARRAPPSRPVAAQAQAQAVVTVAVTPSQAASESSPPKPPTLDGDSEETEFLFRQLFRSSPEHK